MQQQTILFPEGGMRAFLEEENALIRAAHFSGAPGAETVQRRTALIDRVLRDTHRGLSDLRGLPAIVAVGGYGRGELNPHSDIDIMFLCRGETDRIRAPELLYPLWDAGLDIGYSVRTIEESASLARRDLKTRTSLLESRLVAGDRDLYESFLRAMKSDVFYWKPAEYVSEKIAERDAARRKSGGSIYLREPNIKEGTGSLRDIHTALWISIVHFRIGSLRELVSQGIISEGQYAVFSRARNFLWLVRNEMHYLSGRKNDHLSFDLQEQAARDLKYRGSAHLLAVERFMKAYFIHARTVREFLNIVTDAVLPKPPRRWFVRSRSFGPFSLIGKTLAVNTDNACAGGVADVMTAFRIIQTRRAVFSEKMREMVRSCRFRDEEKRSPAAAAEFLAILNDPENLSETLTLMKELRVLGRYLPEFRAVQALARHDYYHLYAVDEHILLAVRSLEQLWSGTLPALEMLRKAFSGLRSRWVLMLAVLLHDLGKVYRADHEHHGAALAEAVLDRLGVSGVDHERIVFLVRNHLAMSHIAQRRELTDRKVIAGFARLIRDRETLDMLYLLTYADISAVNPTSWTQWKASLLQDLYVNTLAHLDSTAQAAEHVQTRLATASHDFREAARVLFSDPEISEFLASMPDQYLLNTSTGKMLEHMQMMRKLPEEQLVISYRHHPDRGYTELTVCSYDAYGMFYRTAGTIAAKNLSIQRARVHTSKNGVMIDTFQITDPDGGICMYNDAWESLCAELRAALMGRTRPPDPGIYRTGRHIPVPDPARPVVEFDNDTSDSFTIIDITARDMVGFLFRVTKALFELNLDIGSAKIVTQGSRVMDSFYVTDLLKHKIIDNERLDKIRESLQKAIL